MNKTVIIFVLYTFLIVVGVLYFFDKQEKTYEVKIEQVEKKYKEKNDSLNNIIRINIERIDSISKNNDGLTSSIDSLKNKKRDYDIHYKNFDNLEPDVIVNLFDSISTRNFKLPR